MRYTLLELTQAVLSSIDGDQINSITDTVEADQVVEIIKTVYDDIQSRGSLMVYKTVFNLIPSNNPAKPVLMSKPTNIDSIDWIKYNCFTAGNPNDPLWSEIKYIQLDSYLRMSHENDPTETNVGSMTVTTAEGYSFPVYYRKDVRPRYWTTFDDNDILFDSIDLAVDTTLQSSKTVCFGTKNTDFQKTDTFVAPFQPYQFALLLNEAKSLAWSELKQAANPKIEEMAKRNWRHLAKSRQHTPTALWERGNSVFQSLPSFGRRTRGQP